MNKGIVLIVALMGIALGIGWYVTAQESRFIQKPLAAGSKAWYNSECEPYNCP